MRHNAETAPAHVAGSGPSVYVLGDSYVSGYTLPRSGESFAYDLARHEGWSATIDGWAGSGFVNEGPCGGHAYAARIDRIPAGTDLAVIEGGLNDTAHLASLSAAAEQAMREAATRARRVVVIGPPQIPARRPQAVQSVDAALAAAARNAGVGYVSLLTMPPVPLGPDRTHPTVSGAQQLALYVAEHLPAG